MKSYCENCGCVMYDGICTNCYEELYIEEQCMEFDIPITEEFANIVQEKKEMLKYT